VKSGLAGDVAEKFKQPDSISWTDFKNLHDTFFRDFERRFPKRCFTSSNDKPPLASYRARALSSIAMKSGF
jgi:hypothetical protein